VVLLTETGAPYRHFWSEVVTVSDKEGFVV